MLRGVAIAAFSVSLSGCGGNVIIAEELAERPTAKFDGGLRASPFDASGATNAPAKAGTGFTDRINEPCDGAGIVEFYALTPSSGAVSATGYVVAFEPPGVIGAVPLQSSAMGTWSGEVVPTALVGSPDCTALESDAVFVLFRSSTGDVAFSEGSPPLYNSDPAYGSPCDILFATGVPGVDRVRAYGMIPGDPKLDGPVALTETSPDSWRGQATAAELPRCGQPGYILMLVAHRGRLLLGAGVYAESAAPSSIPKH